MKQEQNLRHFTIGLMSHDEDTGKTIIRTTIQVLAKSAKQALGRMKRETEGLICAYCTRIIT